MSWRSGVVKGQLPAAATTLVTAKVRSVVAFLSLSNTDPTSPVTYDIYVRDGGSGTSHRVYHGSLAANGSFRVSGCPLDAGWELRGVAGVASKIDYVLALSEVGR